MKLNRLKTHDRYQHFTKQQFDIGECCQNLINQRPFGEHPFYIFAHARTHDDGVSKRLIWQPRLTKPKAQTNSMLFKAYPGTDIVNVLWIIPSRELWDQFAFGQMLENKTVIDSIHKFQYDRETLERKDSDDLSDSQINQIYLDISQQAKKEKNAIQ